MPKNNFQFDDFLKDVNPFYIEPVIQIHHFLLENGCEVKIELAKSGYVVSYTHMQTKRVLLNYVFRKKGLVARIYGDHVNHYIHFVETLPEEMRKAIDKASVCRRLVDPAKCNSRCPMGYDFTINGNHYQKCRYSGFMFAVNDISIPYIKSFLENEIKLRVA